MWNKQNLLNILLFTLDEYSSYPANQMNDFVNTMKIFLQLTYHQ